MATRRDQLQSYQFLLQRVISSLVMRETDPFQSPLRRGTGAIFAGVMIAVIVAAGFGVVGMLTKIGNKTWKTGGSIVVEKETGASYVYRDGVLHPMLNYASALLAGKGKSKVFEVPANSLVDVPRGNTLGIPGAPMSLPDSGRTVDGDWSLCAVPKLTAAGNSFVRTNLVIGRTPTGGEPLTNDALLVKDLKTGSDYLIWHRHRYLLTDTDTVLKALYTINQQPAEVGTAWLDALPEGQDIGPITINNAGKPSAKVPGWHNGDLVYEETGTGRQYYVVLDDGVAELTSVQRFIVAKQMGESSDGAAMPNASDAPQSNELTTTGGVTDPPTEVPKLVSVSPVSDTSCAMFDGRSTPSRIVVGGSFPGLGSGIQTHSQSSTGTSLADRIMVPAGHIAVVRAMASDTAEDSTGTFTLVTDTGKRFSVPSKQVLAQLGYSESEAVAMPASLLLRVPAGPALTPSAARQPAN